MRKTRAEKGITLIALIITIVVLLILAVVTIRAVQGDGIIAKAKEAKTKTEQAQAEEEQRLLEYEYQMAKSQGTAPGLYSTDGTFTSWDEFTNKYSSVFSEDKTTIIENAFESNTQLTGKLVIDKSITEIGARAFYFTSLDTIVIPGTVKKIPTGLICCKDAWATGTYQLVISEGTTTISRQAINLASDSKLIIPESITTLEEHAIHTTAQLGECIVEYAGTKEEWNNLTKDYSENINRDLTEQYCTVICSDGSMKFEISTFA